MAENKNICPDCGREFSPALRQPSANTCPVCLQPFTLLSRLHFQLRHPFTSPGKVIGEKLRKDDAD